MSENEYDGDDHGRRMSASENENVRARDHDHAHGRDRGHCNLHDRGLYDHDASAYEQEHCCSEVERYCRGCDCGHGYACVSDRGRGCVRVHDHGLHERGQMPVDLSY